MLLDMKKASELDNLLDCEIYNPKKEASANCECEEL